MTLENCGSTSGMGWRSAGPIGSQQPQVRGLAEAVVDQKFPVGRPTIRALCLPSIGTTTPRCPRRSKPSGTGHKLRCGLDVKTIRLPSGDQVGNASQRRIGSESSSCAARDVEQPDVLVLSLRVGALHGHALAVGRNGESAIDARRLRWCQACCLADRTTSSRPSMAPRGAARSDGASRAVVHGDNQGQETGDHDESLPEHGVQSIKRA